MIRICINLRDNYEDLFYIDNIERVEVDCFKNYTKGEVDFFTKFRIWLNIDAKEVSDKLQHE